MRVSVLVLVLGMLGLATAVRAGVEQDVRRGVPGVRVVAFRGDSFAELSRRAGAVAWFRDYKGRATLLFAGREKDGGRYFRLGTVRKEMVRAKEKFFVDRGNVDVVEDGLGLAMVKVRVGTHRPKEISMGTENWARVVARDGKGRTVYEVAYYFQLAGEAAQGWRLVVMEDADGRWKVLGNFAGDFWDDTGWQDRVNVKAHWTGKAEEPVAVEVETV